MADLEGQSTELLQSATRFLASYQVDQALPYLAGVLQLSQSDDSRRQLLEEGAAADMALYLPEFVSRWGGTLEAAPAGSTGPSVERGRRILETYDSMTGRHRRRELNPDIASGNRECRWCPRRLSNRQADWDILFLMLRIIRNLCAAGEMAAKHFIESQVPTVVADLADFAATYHEGTDPLCKIAMQVLGNIAMTGQAGAAAVWEAVFPATLLQVAGTHYGLLQSIVCRTLICACTAVPNAGMELTGTPSGTHILVVLLDSCVRLQEGANMTDLAALIGHLALTLGLLPELFQAIATMGQCSCLRERAHNLNVPHINDHHVAVLQLLAALVGEVQPLAPYPTPREQGQKNAAEASILYLLDVLDVLTCATPDVCTASPAADVGRPSTPPIREALQSSGIEALLEVMREICARNDGGAALAGDGDLAALLCRGGLIRRLLNLLRALPPVQSRRPVLPLNSKAADAVAGGRTAVSNMETFQESSWTPLTHPPYLGYRTDLVAVLANALHQGPAVQKEVQELGGIELLLNQCQIDVNSPLLREWALWSVRNLCFNNPEAQKAISELQVQGSLSSAELDQLGLKVRVDPTSHKVDVVRDSASLSPGLSPARRSGPSEALLADQMLRETNLGQSAEDSRLGMWASGGLGNVDSQVGMPTSIPPAAVLLGGEHNGVPPAGHGMLDENLLKQLEKLGKVAVADL